MKKLFSAALVVVGIGVAQPAVGADDDLVCRMPALSSPALELYPDDLSVAELIRTNVAPQAFLDSVVEQPSLFGPPEKKGGPVRYSINDSITAAMTYHHTFLFDTASNQELRKHRFGAFSTDRERDVLGFGMDWNLGDNVVGLGYQLESTRPNPSVSAPRSIVPRSEEVEHAFTLGVTRSWGASD